MVRALIGLNVLLFLDTSFLLFFLIIIILIFNNHYYILFFIFNAVFLFLLCFCCAVFNSSGLVVSGLRWPYLIHFVSMSK